MAEDEGIFVYDVTAVDEFFFNEMNPTTSVSIVLTLPTGKQIGIRLPPEQLSQLEDALEEIRKSLAKVRPPQ